MSIYNNKNNTHKTETATDLRSTVMGSTSLFIDLFIVGLQPRQPHRVTSGLYYLLLAYIPVNRTGSPLVFTIYCWLIAPLTAQGHLWSLLFIVGLYSNTHIAPLTAQGHHLRTLPPSTCCQISHIVTVSCTIQSTQFLSQRPSSQEFICRPDAILPLNESSIKQRIPISFPNIHLSFRRVCLVIDEFLKKQGSEECPDKHCKLTMLCAIVIFCGCVLELTSVTRSRTWWFFFWVFQ